MPYYAYVNGKATIGLSTVQEMNDYVKQAYSQYPFAEVFVLDMKWEDNGKQKIMDHYLLKSGKRMKLQKTE